MTQAQRYSTAVDGTSTYVTEDGDKVDQIAHTYFGMHERHTEALLEFNPGLADLGSVLMAGVIVRLPATTTTPKPRAFRRLWD